jgi:hypothetical protein
MSLWPFNLKEWIFGPDEDPDPDGPCIHGFHPDEVKNIKEDPRCHYCGKTLSELAETTK